MARTPQDVTDAELEILQLLWDKGSTSVRQLAEFLYDGSVTAARVASVQTLLARLESKECVERDRSGSVQLFRAIIHRDELIGRRLQEIAEQLCEGSVTPLLTHLVQGDRLSADERQALRSLIDQLDADDGSDSRRSSKRS